MPQTQWNIYLSKKGTFLLSKSYHQPRLFWCHVGTQTPRPVASTMGVEPNKGHFQDALLSLGTAHTHFGHVQVCSTSAVHSFTCITIDNDTIIIKLNLSLVRLAW